MKVVDPVTGKTKRLYVDPATGKKLYEYTGETYTKYVKRADGTIKPVTMRRTVKSTKMAEVEDAFKLSSGTPIETVYASHANKLKALGNEARKISVNTKPPETSDSAKKAYAHEVASLNSKLNIALKNAPLERQAQVLANSIVSAKRQDNPNMDASDLKKIKGQALAEARSRTHAKKTLVDITDREWEAIQAGAVSNTTLTKILNNTDLDRVKQLATPRTTSTLTPAKQQRVKSMLASGYSQADIADALGVSVSAITNLMN
jgi:predicted nucleotidyltransferase